MACFIVPAAEAVVVAVAEKIEKKKELKETGGGAAVEEAVKVPFSRKLRWLAYLLCGGAVLLMFEHVWHGEVVPWFPFLTSMENADSMAEMFGEMATVGICMTVLVTAVWAVMCIAADAIVKRAPKDTGEESSAQEVA